MRLIFLFMFCCDFVPIKATHIFQDMVNPVPVKQYRKS